MNLYQKIVLIYPQLTPEDFFPTTGTIRLQNDSDGKGDYIKEWKNTIYPQPTQAQLDAIT
jgi:hypothetical protein